MVHSEQWLVIIKAESSVVCRSAKGTAGLPFADSTFHLFCSRGGASRVFCSQADHRGFAETVEITVLKTESAVVCRSAKETTGLLIAGSTPHSFCSLGGPGAFFAHRQITLDSALAP